MDALLKLIITKQANIWLKENPLLLNNQEKQKFLAGLKDYIEDKDIAIDDEVFDFLVQKQLIKNEPRETAFMKYLLKKYGRIKGYNILDVGAGRVCALSQEIAKNGGFVTSMDTSIRLPEKVLEKSNIKAIKKYFKCDEFASDGCGTNIKEFDLVLGLEPCGATEHIIRQSLKYDKPFDISLCATPHKGLNGQTFNNYKDWYKHLANISKEVIIFKNEVGYIATNNEEGLEI